MPLDYVPCFIEYLLPLVSIKDPIIRWKPSKTLSLMIRRTLKRTFFSFFANFWVTELKPFSRKVKQSVENYLNQSLVVRSFFENGFGGTLISKTNVLSVWKVHFAFFCKFFRDKVKTIFEESEAEHSKLFKSIFGHR